MILPTDCSWHPRPLTKSQKNILRGIGLWSLSADGIYTEYTDYTDMVYSHLTDLERVNNWDNENPTMERVSEAYDDRLADINMIQTVEWARELGLHYRGSLLPDLVDIIYSYMVIGDHVKAIRQEFLNPI